MRILWISPTYPFPPIDGGSVRSYHLLRALAARGHTVGVLTFAPPEMTPEKRAAMEQFAALVRCVPRPCPPSLWQRIVFKFGAVPSAVRVYEDAGMRVAAGEALEQFHPDVVVGDLIHIAPYVAKLPVPCVLNLNDSMELTFRREARTETSWRSIWAYRFEARRFRAYETAMGRLVRRLVVVSATDAAYYRELGFSNVDVVANGVDSAFFSPSAVAPVATGRPTIIFTGNLSYPPNVKAVSWFIDQVLPLLRRKRADVQVRLVGLAPSAEVRAMAARDTALQVTGFVPDLRPWLAGSHVYVAPMRSGSGIKNKVLEAMAMGVPVVATSLALQGIPEARAGVHALVADAPDEFAAAVESLLVDRARGAALAAAARHLVTDHYSWPARAAEFEATLTAALTGVS